MVDQVGWAFPIAALKNALFAASIQLGFTVFVCKTDSAKNVHIAQIRFLTREQLEWCLAYSRIAASVSDVRCSPYCIGPHLLR